MPEREMFEKSFQRPTNFFALTEREQWAIDRELGILNWTAEGLSDEDLKRIDDHYSPGVKA